MKNLFKISFLLCSLLLILSSCDLLMGKNSTDEKNKGSGGSSASVNDRARRLDFIFNTKTLGSTTITIKRSQWKQLCDDYNYFYKNENCVKAESYVYEKDGKKWELKNVGFRLRGNTSRFCPQGYDSGKEQNVPNVGWSKDYYAYIDANPNNQDYRQTHFKVDFEEFCQDDEEQKLDGVMKGIALKRMDASCAREIFCYDLFRRYGIWTAPHASHTRVTINIIEDLENAESSKTTVVNYGVYEMFEETNKQSLKARDKDENPEKTAWKNSKGNLWKCANDLRPQSLGGMGIEDVRIIYKGQTQPANMRTNGREDSERIGFVDDRRNLDLKTNKDSYEAAAAELTAFVNELDSLPRVKSEDETEKINQIKDFYNKWFDVDFFLKTYAINILCGMDDDYWGNANNFYLYFGDDLNGNRKVWFIPFDYDNTLGCSIHGNDGDEGPAGVKQSPLKWGRGADRPLMDKILMVPEFKQKFIDLLVEVSSEKNEWNFEKCSKRFLEYKALVEPYLYSEDLANGHLGTLGWNDSAWKNDFKLTYEPNLYDFTRKQFLKNLELAEADPTDPKPIVDEDKPEENLEKESQDKTIPDGKTVSLNGEMLNPNAEEMGDNRPDSYSKFYINVTPKYNGLYIEKRHSPIWEHIAIHVKDLTENPSGNENVRIETDQQTNSFLYPFVKKGHTYRVWITAQGPDWKGWRTTEDWQLHAGNLDVEAIGGLGNFRTSYSSWKYDSETYSVKLNDLEFTRPEINGLSYSFSGTICDGGVWKGNQNYPSLNLVGSSLDYSAASYFICGKTSLHFIATLKFDYENTRYETTVFENNGDTLIIDYAHLPDADTLVKEEGAFTFEKGGMKTEYPCKLIVEAKDDGLHIQKEHSSLWPHITVRVRDITENFDSAYIDTDDTHNTFVYPFVEKGHLYKVYYIGMDEDWRNWQSTEYAMDIDSVKAVGGLGKYKISYTSYEYDMDEKYLSINFNNFKLTRPAIEESNYRVTADLCQDQTWGPVRMYLGWPNLASQMLISTDYDNIIEFLNGHMIHINMEYCFDFNGYKYKYTFFNNENALLDCRSIFN